VHLRYVVCQKEGDVMVIVKSRIVKRDDGWYLEAFFDGDLSRPLGGPIGPFPTESQANEAQRDFMQKGIPTAGQA
jgi:hypothetical protein